MIFNFFFTDHETVFSSKQVKLKGKKKQPVLAKLLKVKTKPIIKITKIKFLDIFINNSLFKPKNIRGNAIIEIILKLAAKVKSTIDL